LVMHGSPDDVDDLLASFVLSNVFALISSSHVELSTQVCLVITVYLSWGL